MFSFVEENEEAFPDILTTSHTLEDVLPYKNYSFVVVLANVNYSSTGNAVAYNLSAESSE